MVIQILFNCGLVITMLALVLECTRMLCLDMHTDGGHIFRRFIVITVGTLDIPLRSSFIIVFHVIVPFMNGTIFSIFAPTDKNEIVAPSHMDNKHDNVACRDIRSDIKGSLWPNK